MAEILIGESASQGVQLSDLKNFKYIVVDPNPIINVATDLEEIGDSEAIGTPVEQITERSLTPEQKELQARLHSKLPEFLKESIEVRKLIPDPVQAMIDLLARVPGDYESWRDVIEEPYG